MKTDKVFAHEQLKPCPSCSGPRAGIDCDDDYYVVPGVVRMRPDCHLPQMAVEWDGYPDYDRDRNDQAEAMKEALDNSIAKAHEIAAAFASIPCPSCSGELNVARNNRKNRWLIQCENRVRRPGRNELRSYIESVPGCDACARHSEHVGVGIVSADK